MRLLLAQLCASLLTLGGLAGACCCAAPVNVLRNTDFEKRDTDGHLVDWTYDDKVWKVSDAEGVNGTRGMVFDAGEGTTGSPLMQRVKAVPGAVYRYGVQARTKGLMGSAHTCARVCVLMENVHGQFIDGFYGGYRPKGDTPNWLTLEAVTPPLPKEAAWLTIRLEVLGQAKGVAWFDDPVLVISGDTPIDRLYSSAYRDVQAEDDVTFVVGLNATDVDLTKCRCLFSLVAADGRRVERKPDVLVPGAHAKLKVPVSSLALGSNDVSFRIRTPEGKKFETSLAFTRIQKEPSHAVAIDRFGRCLVDGKPFFPLGMFWSVGKAADGRVPPPLSVAALKDYAKGPFNCIMPYTPPSQDVWDACAETGIKIIYPLAGTFSRDWDPDKGPHEAARKAILVYRDHPALLAWYMNDEIPVAFLKNLIGRYEMTKSLDPNHPTWACLYQVDQMRDYLPTFDIAGSDAYPIEEYPIGRVSEFTDKTRENTLGVRPLWQVPQAFDWATCRGAGRGRMPTREEMCNMSWQAIAGGANGLVYYSYTYLTLSPTTPPEKALADARAAVGEVKRFEKMILLGGKAPAFSLSSRDVAARTWSDGKATYVLLVNKTRERQTVKFAAESSFGSVKVALGDAPVSRDGKTLTVELGPIAQAIYKLK